MNTQKIATGNRVLTNSPYRPVAHAKFGVVTAFNPHGDRDGIYSVVLDDTDGLPFFYHPKELTELAKERDIMPKQEYAKGTEVIVNVPEATEIHGKRAVVRSFNPGAISKDGVSMGTYGVMVVGERHPSWLFPHEFELAEPEPSPKTRELIEYMADDLHRSVCHYNHVDECGYYYGSQSEEHKGWIGRVERTVEHLASQGVTDVETIAKVIHAVERIR